MLVLDYPLEFHIISRGWLFFKVRLDEDRRTQLSRNWKWGTTGLFLKEWKINFDVEREPHNLQHIWVLLLGLPMVFGKEDFCIASGNKLGWFVSMEEGWDSKVDKQCTRMLVELDLREGLLEEVKQGKKLVSYIFLFA